MHPACGREHDEGKGQGEAAKRIANGAATVNEVCRQRHQCRKHERRQYPWCGLQGYVGCQGDAGQGLEGEYLLYETAILGRGHTECPPANTRQHDAGEMLAFLVCVLVTRGTAVDDRYEQRACAQRSQECKHPAQNQHAWHIVPEHRGDDRHDHDAGTELRLGLLLAQPGLVAAQLQVRRRFAVHLAWRPHAGC